MTQRRLWNRGYNAGFRGAELPSSGFLRTMHPDWTEEDTETYKEGWREGRTDRVTSDEAEGISAYSSANARNPR